MDQLLQRERDEQVKALDDGVQGGSITAISPIKEDIRSSPPKNVHLLPPLLPPPPPPLDLEVSASAPGQGPDLPGGSRPPQSHTRLNHLIHPGASSTHQFASSSSTTTTTSFSPPSATAAAVTQTPSPPPHMRVKELMYPDDINRDRWHSYQQSPSQLDYSPDVSDSSLLLPPPNTNNSANTTGRRQTRRSDIDSLFEESDAESGSPSPSHANVAAHEEEVELKEEAEDSGRLLDPTTTTIIDRSSPEGLNDQLQGRLVVSSVEKIADGRDWRRRRRHSVDSNLTDSDVSSDYHLRWSDVPEWEDTKAGQNATTSEEHQAGVEEEQNLHNCLCGCSSSSCCTCHPLYCSCKGCDHSEQVKRLQAEAEEKWGPDEEGESTCGCRGDQRKCLCPPGVCSCTTCEDQSENIDDQEDSKRLREQIEERTCGCNGMPSKCSCLPGLCRCTTCGDHTKDTQELCDCTLGKKCQCDPEECACVGCDEHLAQRPYEGSDREYSPPEKVAEVEEQPVSDRRWEQGAGTENVIDGHELHLPGSQTPGTVILSRHADLDATSGCSCEKGNSCTCSIGSCKCRTERADEGTKQLENQPSKTRRSSNSAANHEHAAHQSQVSTIQLHIEATDQTTTQSPTRATFSREESVVPSRPDTPRPPDDLLPTTPYTSSRMSEYIRQSVEPEVPRPNWARESTPAYDERSETPSPYSRRGGDVEMRDVSYEGTQGASGMSVVAPMTSTAPLAEMSNYRPASPKRPLIPPIPNTAALSPLKQPKRGDRRKSTVQGSKVDKRSTTGSAAAAKQSKSRNVTRKPTTGVGKLVEQAKKRKATVAASAAAVPTTPSGNGVATVTTQNQGDANDEGNARLSKERDRGASGGKVAEAVATIEKQLRQQEEEEEERPKQKQKDGTPVRRSARANKGMRNSLGPG